MPDFWEFPTVSMGLGPISAIYQARFNRYLQDRGLKNTENQRVWAFLGDGETYEPESLGAMELIRCGLILMDGDAVGWVVEGPAHGPVHVALQRQCRRRCQAPGRCQLP